MQMKKSYKYIAVLIIGAIIIGYNLYMHNLKRPIKRQIEAYFDLVYQGYEDLEYHDLSQYLDDNKHGKQLINMTKRNIEHLRILSECGYSVRPPLRADIDYEEISMKSDQSEVVLDLRANTQRELDYVEKYGIAYYPVYASLESHELKLKLVDGDWKITDHDYYSRDHKLDDVSFSSSLSEEEIIQIKEDNGCSLN